MPPTARWEYLAPLCRYDLRDHKERFDGDPLDESLEYWGKRGWELVAVVPLPRQDPNASYQEFRYIFKRPWGFVED